MKYLWGEGDKKKKAQEENKKKIFVVANCETQISGCNVQVLDI